MNNLENVVDEKYGFSFKEKWISLNSAEVGLFKKICDIFLKTWGNKFSEKYINEQIRNIIGRVLVDQNNAEKKIEKLIVELKEYDKKNTAYILIEGIILEGDKFKIGKCVFRNVSEELITELRCKSIHAFNAMFNSSINTKRDIIIDNKNSYVLVEFLAVADPQKTKELALIETRRVIDILRYTIAWTEEDHTNVMVGIAGELIDDRPCIPVFGHNGRICYKSSVQPKWKYPVRLNKEKIMSNRYVPLFNLLEKNELTDFEEAILTSIHWFSMSYEQREDENKLLNLMTSLEAFCKDGFEIRKTISETVALVTSDDVDNRKKIKKFIMDRYKERSKISHGERQVISNGNLTDIRTTTKIFINKMIKNMKNIKGRDDLLKEIDNLKLSGKTFDSMFMLQESYVENI